MPDCFPVCPFQALERSSWTVCSNTAKTATSKRSLAHTLTGLLEVRDLQDSGISMFQNVLVPR